MATRKKAAPKKRPTDVNQLAHLLGRMSTDPKDAPDPTKADISRVMAVLGRKGGKIGGKKRAANMSPERRSEIALKAARSRWAKPIPHPWHPALHARHGRWCY
jgi:hypothetical protein